MKGKDKYAGLILSLALHGLLIALLLSMDMQTTAYRPPVQGMLIEFPEETPPPPEAEPTPKPVRTEVGIEPRVPEPVPQEETRLVQKSEAPVKSQAENRSPETALGDDGNVPKPEPPAEKPIDRRALFSSRRNADSVEAEQVAREVTRSLKAGQSAGNTEAGNPDGQPTAKLEGRTIMGSLPLPEYGVAAAGTVVVRITVDQYGTVLNALPGVKGTTVQDATLWEAAKQAALKARFNMSESAPAVQEGTISYIFTLK